MGISRVQRSVSCTTEKGLDPRGYKRARIQMNCFAQRKNKSDENLFYPHRDAILIL